MSRTKNQAAPSRRRWRKKILESILPYLGIEPRYTEKELAELNRTVPRVTSMTTAEAENSLKTKSLKSQVVGEGVTVIRQIPESGSSIPKDGTVWLYTDETPHRDHDGTGFPGEDRRTGQPIRLFGRGSMSSSPASPPATASPNRFANRWRQAPKSPRGRWSMWNSSMRTPCISDAIF